MHAPPGLRFVLDYINKKRSSTSSAYSIQTTQRATNPRDALNRSIYIYMSSLLTLLQNTIAYFSKCLIEPELAVLLHQVYGEYVAAHDVRHRKLRAGCARRAVPRSKSPFLGAVDLFLPGALNVLFKVLYCTNSDAQEFFFYFFYFLLMMLLDTNASSRPYIHTGKRSYMYMHPQAVKYSYRISYQGRT